MLSFDTVHAQDYYFPPNNSAEWETSEPASLGWVTDSLFTLRDYLEVNNTKAFLVLKDGRIAIEWYFDGFKRDSSWYWASSGKSLTALVLSQEIADGTVDIEESVSEYLGSGWTSCAAANEQKIKVHHLLSMTTGLNRDNFSCTTPECLRCEVDPGSRWFYQNGPYLKVAKVAEAASGKTFNQLTRENIMRPIGGAGFWAVGAEKQLYWSQPRSMARVGLLHLANGKWDGQQVLTGTSFLAQATSSSQTLNPAYGYLWWLNGKDRYMLPSSNLVFDGMLDRNMPSDGYSALGSNGQFLDIVPSEGLVVVRMGRAPSGQEDELNGLTLHRGIWQRLKRILELETRSTETFIDHELAVTYAKATRTLSVIGSLQGQVLKVEVRSLNSQLSLTSALKWGILVPDAPAGVYFVSLTLKDGRTLNKQFWIE